MYFQHLHNVMEVGKAYFPQVIFPYPGRLYKYTIFKKSTRSTVTIFQRVKGAKYLLRAHFVDLKDRLLIYFIQNRETSIEKLKKKKK